MGTGAIVGITIGSFITAVLVFALLIYVFKLWLRGPTLGSDQRKRLDGKVVAITGKKVKRKSNNKFLFHFSEKSNLYSCYKI